MQRAQPTDGDRKRGIGRQPGVARSFEVVGQTDRTADVLAYAAVAVLVGGLVVALWLH